MKSQVLEYHFTMEVHVQHGGCESPAALIDDG
jgi:hypothetical protein